MSDKPHSGIPLWNTESFGRWDEATGEKPWTKPCRFDGSSADYWEFLNRAEKLCAPIAGKARSRVGFVSSIGIPPVVFQSVYSRYWIRSAKTSANYLLSKEVVDAIQHARLTWVDAEVFAALPDSMALIIEQPEPNLRLFSSGTTGTLEDAWHNVQDMLLLRVKDPDTRARLCDNLNLNPADESIQLFTWIAGALHAGERGGFKQGALNWGLFHVSTNVKLADLAEGMDDLLDYIGRQAEAIGPNEIPEPISMKPRQREFLRATNALDRGLHFDYSEGAEEQKASVAGCMEFLAKFVLLVNCEGVKPLLEKVPPPGLRAILRPV